MFHFPQSLSSFEWKGENGLRGRRGIRNAILILPSQCCGNRLRNNRRLQESTPNRGSRFGKRKIFLNYTFKLNCIQLCKRGKAQQNKKKKNVQLPVGGRKFPHLLLWACRLLSLRPFLVRGIRMQKDNTDRNFRAKPDAITCTDILALGSPRLPPPRPPCLVLSCLARSGHQESPLPLLLLLLFFMVLQVE